jgi:multidrug efflux pump subunit AcrA (membrane-fusion protein)
MGSFALRQIGLWLIFAGLFFGCGDAIGPGTTEREETPAVIAPVEIARLIDQPVLYEAVGTVRAETASILSAKLMGTVEEILVSEGSRVHRGDPLVKIDQRQVAAQLRQAEAALAEARRAEAAAVSARKAAEAGAELAQATYGRYRQLMRDESASRQEFDEVEARFRQAEAAREQARQMAAAARQRVQQADAFLAAASVADEDAVIRAPYDGLVRAKLLEAGALVTPGTPVLELESIGGHRVEIVLTETHFSAVRLNQTMEVRIPAAAEETLQGVVDIILPAADPGSRSFLIKIGLPDHPAVRSGMFARVMVPVGMERVLAVADTALLKQGQLTALFVVDDSRTARFRLVRTGRRFSGGVEILSGLEPGSRYVLRPPPTLVDGARVEAAP